MNVTQIRKYDKQNMTYSNVWGIITGDIDLIV